MYPVYDAIVANTHPVDTFLSFQLLHARRPGILGESLYCRVDPLDVEVVRLPERPEVSTGRCTYVDAIRQLQA